MAKDGSRRYHDRVARQYDAIYDDPYWHFHDLVTWEAVKPHLPKVMPAACADLGCGTGKWGLKLLKSGYEVTFLDHSAAMVEQVRSKLESNPRAKRAKLVVGDIIDMPDLPSGSFHLILAMGDPLSICNDPASAAREVARLLAPGGVGILTADNKLAAIDHFVDKGNLDELEAFIKSSRTHWLTQDARERFELHTFTPKSLRALFTAVGLEVLGVSGKTIIPARSNKRLLEADGSVERLVAMELKLASDPAAAARASHLQITVKKAL